MMLKNSTRMLGVLGVLMIILTACQSNLQEQIIGQWRLRDGNQEVGLVLSFKEDNEITLWIEDVPRNGTYTWIDEQTIQITFSNTDITSEILGTVQIEGDQLMITNEQGDTDTLIRVE